MNRPAVALLTDFGTRDPYVSIMKGVIRQRVACDIVDLTHEIPPGDVLDGAFFLQYAGEYYRHDSARTVICAVVDPGVGTNRRIIAIRSAGLWIVGPDNGILSLLVRPGDVIHEVTRSDLFLTEGSRTFHGRDRFAPVAAAIASGFEVEGLGPPIDGGDLRKIDYSPPVYEPELVTGTVISVDRFGNIVTDIEPSLIAFEKPWSAMTGEKEISHWANTYDEGRGLEIFMIEGSRGTLEISVADGSAATLLQPERQASVSVRPRPEGT